MPGLTTWTSNALGSSSYISGNQGCRQLGSGLAGHFRLTTPAGCGWVHVVLCRVQASTHMHVFILLYLCVQESMHVCVHGDVSVHG